MTPEELADQIGKTPFPARALMTKIVMVALANSQKRTPVKTGLLRRSETTRVEPDGMVGAVGTNVIYAPFVHNGTRSMPARPFFTEGIADSRAQIDDLLAAAGEQWLADLGAT